METIELRAKSAAVSLGLPSGTVIEAAQWDGTEQNASDILDWVGSHHGVAAQNGEHIIVVDNCDIVFARPQSWVAKVPGGFTVFGPSAIDRAFVPADRVGAGA